jgi:hypothetical protein
VTPCEWCPYACIACPWQGGVNPAAAEADTDAKECDTGVRKCDNGSADGTAPAGARQRSNQGLTTGSTPD